METQQGLQGSAFEQVKELAMSFLFGPFALKVVDNQINSTKLMQTYFFNETIRYWTLYTL